MIDTRFYELIEGGLSVSDLCARLDLAAPEGSLAETRIFEPAPLVTSQAGSLAFLESRKHSPTLETAKASACFVTDALADAVAERNIVPLICKAPKYQLARATDILVKAAKRPAEIAQDSHIHPSTIIGPGVVIGSNVSIGPNSVITNAIIGDDTHIGACTVIGGTGFGVVTGPDGAIMSVPHVGRVLIGRNVRIGSNTCIDRGQLGDTVIGDDCQIDNLVQIAHNCVLERGCALAGRVGISGSCHIGEGVLMGGSAGLADHITVGPGARLAAFAGVMHDVPAGETWSGIPAMPIRDHMRIVAKAKRDIRK
ncbi:UDP-3-O-(3-hydroxymyristoyl)glucosamine N-acyltransferase [Algimonas porphyrae]|uniref:UDP-3-O-acylglucosamine N-acyltransferase n=1 Tax=Algimonas porphyrae TaxID=1128113 RepID=A0ABQ5UYA8_9PROT|nr:UDP-3-O-(3-hydroxymyristoyl)glucosamine N-acyltransferase [Algimonas porphyrae]GLQ20295.1 UDP-3-O-acylglucosamine N-acyltransferase [Algimonas porphyrae]